MSQETNSSTLLSHPYHVPSQNVDSIFADKNTVPSLIMSSSSTSMSLASPTSITPESSSVSEPFDYDLIKPMSSTPISNSLKPITTLHSLDSTPKLVPVTQNLLYSNSSLASVSTKSSLTATSSSASSSSSSSSSHSLPPIAFDNAVEQSSTSLSGNDQGLLEVHTKVEQASGTISKSPSSNSIRPSTQNTMNMYSNNNNNGVLRSPSLSSGSGSGNGGMGTSSTSGSSATTTMSTPTSSTLNGIGSVGGPTSGVSDAKLKRFLEHNQRLKEQLEMRRISVSEASQSLIKFVTNTKDSLLPTLWGTAPSDPFSKQSSSCCTIS